MTTEKRPFFDNADMQDTIPHLPTFCNVYEILEQVDIHDAEIMTDLLTKDELTKIFPHGYDAARQDLRRLIEDVWNIAYQMGYDIGVSDTKEWYDD